MAAHVTCPCNTKKHQHYQTVFQNYWGIYTKKNGLVYNIQNVKTRGGHITASNLHEVSHQRSETQQTGKNSLLNKLMNYPSSVNTLALNYGRQNESRACKLYQQNSEQHHNCFVIKTTGLHVRSDIPFICAFPDALIECKCHRKGLLEIKCKKNKKENTEMI